MVSAIVFINNNCKFECSVAVLQGRQCRLAGGAQYVNLWGSVHRATIMFNQFFSSLH